MITIPLVPMFVYHFLNDYSEHGGGIDLYDKHWSSLSLIKLAMSACPWRTPFRY